MTCDSDNLTGIAEVGSSSNSPFFSLGFNSFVNASTEILFVLKTPSQTNWLRTIYSHVVSSTGPNGAIRLSIARNAFEDEEDDEGDRRRSAGG